MAKTRNLKKLLERLNHVEYYMCPSDVLGKGFHATSIELFPAEVTRIKYLIRREMTARRGGQIAARILTVCPQLALLPALLS